MNWHLFLLSILMFHLSWVPIVAAQTGTSGQMNRVADNNNRFALDLYSVLKNNPGDLFFSPFSISSVLSLTSAGARNNTAGQMGSVLHFNDINRDFHRDVGQYLKQVRKLAQDGSVQLQTANSIWPQKDMTLLPDFLTIAGKDYGVDIQPVDYSGEAARDEINSWVFRQTERMIPELIGKGDLDPATLLVLVNAIYFLGQWQTQFKPEDTIPADFFRADGSKREAAMMSMKSRFQYFETPDVQILTLPYTGRTLSMTILLPKTTGGLEKLEGQMAFEQLDQWFAGMHEKEIRVFIPKFKITWGTNNISRALIQMGMIDPFDAGKADFSGMTGAKDMYISSVLHQARIEVDEKGTEASAASAVIMRKSNGGSPTVFRADHPFVFIIRETQTGGFLFIGRVSE